MRQWMMRITAYADRLLDDLDRLDWPSRSSSCSATGSAARGRAVRFRPTGPARRIEVFTTRPDTLFGATFMVLAPEHPLVDALVTAGRLAGGHPRGLDRRRATPAAAVTAYRAAAAARPTDRAAGRGKEKTGVFTGAYATNPVNGERDAGLHRRLRADGLRHRRDHGRAGRDQRDFDFARRLRPADRRTVQPARGPRQDTRVHRRRRPINSANDEISLERPGQGRGEGRDDRLAGGQGAGRGAITYKLRDWLFSRQRYWGEPFPIVYDETGRRSRCPSRCCRSSCPRSTTTRPQAPSIPTTPRAEPVPPLAGHRLGRGRAGPGRRWPTYRRELNVMPQWAGSCWYELRYLDPTNDERARGPGRERYWMGPPTERRWAEGGGGRGRGDPAAWTCTSAASSTRCCTCCTPGSGTRCCSTWATCRQRGAVPAAVQPGLHPGLRLPRRARPDVPAAEVEEHLDGRGPTAELTVPGRASRSSASTGRWASR
jgi:leucyl-tRNA synthetase